MDNLVAVNLNHITGASLLPGRWREQVAAMEMGEGLAFSIAIGMTMQKANVKVREDTNLG